MTSVPTNSWVVAPPVSPMLAKPLGSSVPVAGDWLFEPKWDGFRCLIFRDGDHVFVQSRSGEDLAYAFPEVVEAALTVLPERIALDGELVIAEQDRLWFELLGQRIRPRSEAGGWKIAELAAQHPASYVAFDLLSLADEDFMGQPQVRRREVLESVELSPPFHLTPVTADAAMASRWFEMFEGAGLDGVIAKPPDLPYQPGKRVLGKIKHARSADVVVAGWRAHKSPGPDGEPVVGSLLLGLFDDAGVLHNVGAAASFSVARRAELAAELAPLAVAADEPHPWRWGESDAAGRVPGGPSRWTGGKDLSFHLLRPTLVAEVGYDHMEGTRFRHVAKLLRFRPDRRPESCTFAQLDQPISFELGDVVPGLGR